MSEAKRVMEAALFISSGPLALDQLARISGINSLGHVKEILEELQRDYRDRALEISPGQDGWSMQVRPGLLQRVAHLTPYSDLGEGHKRTLALVTLKEPVKQSEIIKSQGNKAYSYIKDLRERGLIVAEKEGHTKVLKLTQEFERYFGEEKGSIKEQLQRHLEASGRTEPKPAEAAPPEEEEGPGFLDEKPGKEKARSSVIRQGAAREVPSKDEFGGEDDEPDEEEPESEEKGLKASHGHAFKEID